MKQKVYVVTNTELGWDCVCAVYTNEKAALYSKAECNNNWYVFRRYI